MIFISLIKFRKQAKDVAEVGKKLLENLPPNVKIIGTYWTLGRYDSVWVYEAPSEKEAVKLGVAVGGVANTETMTAISRDEAIQLL